MNIILRSATAVLAAAVVFAATQTAAMAETLHYTVLRDGKTIGTHDVTVEGKGEMTQVRVNTDIEIKVLFVTAYKFKHKSQEIWAGGKLVSLTSTTDDDGTDKKLTARAANGRITVDSVVKGQDRRQNADAGTLPASLWNPETVKQSALLNTLDGKIMKIDVKDIGAESVEAGGKNVDAHHFAISGELTRELWFDTDGRLVRMRFPDKTNSEIVYALD